MIPLDMSRAWPPGIQPRQWQPEALSALASSSASGPLVEAIMGAGKSVLITGIIRSAIMAGCRRIVVSAPTEALVEQLSEDLVKYVGMNNVGLFYGRQKTPLRRVMVTCFPSVSNFVEAHGAGCELWIVDECHLSENDQIKSAFHALNPTHRVGLSATPFKEGKDKLSLFDELTYSYGLGRAIEDGVLVPWEVVHPEEGGDLDDICLSMLQTHNPRGGGIIGAKSIEDAETFAERCNTEWAAVLPIHSGMSAKKKDHALDALKSGKVRALVHVDMLTTGINIPWLRWLFLRRKYNSATSFLQFFGRGLRASPGKTQALIFDPWMQLESFSLNYAARLGGDIKLQGSKATIPEDEQLFDLVDLPEFKPGVKIPAPTAKRAVAAWTRAIVHAAQAAQIVAPSEWDGDGSWRKKIASEKQTNALRKMHWFTKHLPKGHVRDGVKKLIEEPEQLTSGAASDIMDVLSGSATHGAEARAAKKHWEWESPVPIPAIPKRVLKGIKLEPV